MNIRYIKRHLPFRNSKHLILRTIFRFRNLQVILAFATFGLSLSGASMYVMQVSANQSLPVPVSPIPKETVVDKSLDTQADIQFKEQQQFCEKQIVLFEQQIEGNTYLKQHVTSNQEKQRLTEELKISEAKLATQVKMCDTLKKD